ncbi:trypsin-like serine protease [Vibrio mediterranei]
MNNKVIWAVGLAVFSVNTYAVRYGQDVNAADYNDYIVRFEVPDTNNIVASCGGTLLSQEYILTAAHCVGNYNSAYTSNHEWFVDAGAPDSITVYQSVNWDTDNKVSTTYTVIPLATSSSALTEAHQLASKERDAVIAMNPNSTFTPTVTESQFESALHRDVVLIKLATKVSQSTSAVISPIFDETDNSFKPPFDTTLTFRGWGQTENGRPTVMQSTSMHYDQIGTGRSMGNAFKLDSGFKACNNEVTNCYYDLGDMIRFSPDAGTEATGASGDSGTPLLYNNAVIGVAKDIPNDYTYTRFTTLTYYLADIAKNIGEVSAPSGVDYKVDKGSNQKFVLSTHIQNLSSTTETLNPYLTGDSAWFTVTGCNTTLQQFESCTLTITSNASEQALSEDLSSTIYLDDTKDKTISISLKVTDSSNGSNGSNGNSGSTGGGSGGGSLSWLSLAALLFVRKIRTK